MEESDIIIRKGPWKLEEDQVLINHVNMYGPRDWSSIRSKRLLQRTGKSCRLRWVNKLRPNLKTGCKFSADEEMVVIELQAQSGNKWAKIATYLQGRTDNDVKNFWSSRQKRLARILRTSTTPSKSKLQKNDIKGTPIDYDISSMEAPKLSSASEAESFSKPVSCSSSCCTEKTEPSNMFNLPDLYNPNLLGYGTNFIQHEFNFFEMKLNIKSESPIYFHSIPPTQPLDSTFSSQSHELFFSRFHDFNNFDVFQEGNNVQFPFEPQLFEPFGSRSSYDDGVAREKIDNNPMMPESFFNEFPADIFDHIEIVQRSPEN